MAYSVPRQWSHGDVPTAAYMNAYKDGLNAIYTALSNGKRHICFAKYRQWETRASDTTNDGLQDETDSYLTVSHAWRWLFYSGEGAIKSLDDAEESPLSNDNPDTHNVFDMDSVEWLNYGMVYKITGVKWAMEDWEP